FFSSRRRHTRSYGDWSSDVCSSDLNNRPTTTPMPLPASPSDIPYDTKIDITPRELAPSDLRIPMSRVFSTTIMKKIAMIPKPARSEERRVGKEGNSRRTRVQCIEQI